MSNLPLVILGAGGHARVVADLLRRAGFQMCGCVAPESPKVEIVGCPWLGSESAFDRDAETVNLANGIGSVGPIGAHRDVFTRWHGRGYRFPALIHPAAQVANDVHVAEGAVVMAGCVIQSGARVAANAIVNTSAVIEHDCNVGSHAHIAPGAVLSGGVTVGVAVHVGTGAVVVQGITIGDEAVIGAGAVVLVDVAPRTVVGGVPAKVLTAGT